MDYACRFRRFRFMAIHRRVLLEAERYCIYLDTRNQTTFDHRLTMSTQTLGLFLSWTQLIAFFVLCVVLPFRFVLHTGRFKRGILLVWILAAAFSFCSVLLGEYLRRNIDNSLANSCFEGGRSFSMRVDGIAFARNDCSGHSLFSFFATGERLAKKQEGVDHVAAA